MANKKNNYVGKNRFEKQAYSSFILGSENGIDKTEEEKDKIFKTDESSVHEDEDKKPEIKPKSNNLKITDFLRSHILESVIIAVLVGIIIWLFSLYTSNNREIGEINTKLDFYYNQIDDIANKYQSTNDKLNGIDKIIVEINKDLEYLKEGIRDIKSIK
ncbi:MAG TPA: hypothetical protein PKN54_02615 [Candidatus Cloacimonas acidaminovorans]|nr:hypothetical protein [Candidatus Cloacimonas acidaminovorans]